MACNANPLTSQRTVINIMQTFTYYYAMIDHFKFGDQQLAPNTTYGGGKLWASMIDAQGWPNDPAIHGHGFNGGGIRFPSTDNYGSNAGENYIIDWTGTGEFTFTSGTWTLISSVNAQQIGGVGSGHFKSITGSGFTSGSVTVNLSNLAEITGLPNLVSLNFNDSDLDLNGNYIKNLRIYRSGDASRLAAGKFFRLPFLQTFADLNPSAIRFMDWVGSCSDHFDQSCRWENRTKPDYGTYTSGNYNASPVYGNADYAAWTGVGPGTVHQYTLGAATPTASNPKTTPVTMQHGEVVTTTMNTGQARAGGFNITGIQQNATPRVDAPGHNYVNGDIIVHFIPTASGMQRLDRRKCQVSGVVAGVSYIIDIDTSTFAAYSGSGAISTYYMSLNVNGRGDYPMVFPDGGTFPSIGSGLSTGVGYLNAGGSGYTFWFDKTLTPMNDSSSNPIKGAWIYRNPGGTTTGPQGSFAECVPIELCTALIIELNQLSVSQGINNPIHMWMCIPFRGLISTDAVWAGDYSSGSNFATNMVDVLLNGSTVNGVPYAGMKSITGPSLLLEHGNETWNVFNFQSSAGNGILGKDNYGGTNGYPMARSVGAMRDIKAAFPSETRIKYVMAGQQDDSSQVLARINNTGDTMYTTLKQAGWGATPISEHDAMALAPYILPWGNFFTTYNNDFYDDNAKYFGADNSGTLRVTGSGQTLTCTTNGSFQLVTSALSGGVPVVGQIVNVPGFGARKIIAISGVNPTYTLTLDVLVALGGSTVLTTSNFTSTAVTAGPVVVGQSLVGPGIPPGTFVKTVSGISPNYTLTTNNTIISAAATVASSLFVMTANASTSSSSLVITASNIQMDATSIGGAVIIGGSGIIPNQSFVIGISGTFPNYTLTLDHPISFVGGTVGVSNRPGGNYIGAANQAAALASFVGICQTGSGGSFTQTINRYCDPAHPTLGLDATYAAAAGKPIIEYEGGVNWGDSPDHAGGIFQAAVNQSSQWAQAEKDFWDARATIPNLAMPALYASIRGSEQGRIYIWAYVSPDNYDSSHVEGSALRNIAFWPAICARNQAFNECPGTILPTGGRGTHLKTRLHLH